MKFKWLYVYVAVFLFACSNSPEHTIFKLPSGIDIKAKAIRKMFFLKDDPALVFEYQTDCDIDNIDQLRKEAEMIWPFFRSKVEKEGFNNAIITAVTPPEREFIVFSTSTSYSFVVSKNSNGTWDFDSWQRNYESEASQIAEKYIETTQSEGYDALEIFHIPENYTAEEIFHEKEGLTAILKVISHRFGAINSFARNNSSSQISGFLLQSGSLDYWSKHPYFITIAYDVHYALQGKGLVIFRFSIIKNKLVVYSVWYGLPTKNPETELFIKNLENNIMEELKKI